MPYRAFIGNPEPACSGELDFVLFTRLAKSRRRLSQSMWNLYS